MRLKTFLEASPLFSLHQTYDEILNDFQSRLSAEGVHFIQALILAAIFFEERAVQPSELARLLSASRSNISHAIRGLERAKLIDRNSSADDARSYFLSLTKEGKRRVSRIIKLIDSVENQLEPALNTATLLSQLKKFKASYQGVVFS